MKKKILILTLVLACCCLLSAFGTAHMVLSVDGRGGYVGGDGGIERTIETVINGDRLEIQVFEVEEYTGVWGYVELSVDNPQLLCDGTLTGIEVNEYCWTIGAEEYVVLYEGAVAGQYPITTTAPTAVGSYKVSLAFKSSWDNSSNPEKVSHTTAIPFDLVYAGHSWQYTVDKFIMNADCVYCGEHASVQIDTSAVYEASRTYDGEELEYEIAYEDGWTGKQGIEPYYILFDGYETVSETQSVVYDRAYVKPTKTGSYEVRISLLEDSDDPNTAWLSTEKKPYYLADISVNDCSVLSYGTTEISQFTEPELKDGYYQVGTLSELLWCTYKGGNSINVALTNDIVVNPITVTDDGKVRSAKYNLYQWQGFGSEKTAFCGHIEGNGYTIYGIYHPKEDGHYAGFINYCEDSDILNLNIENSVIQDQDSAGLAGHYNCKARRSYIKNCTVLNSYLTGSSSHGAMIGWMTNDSNQVGVLFMSNCVNASTVKGSSAGGIIGYISEARAISIYNCCNTGNILSDANAGGIIGYLDVSDDSSPLVSVSKCLNIGKISGTNCSGGIIGNTGKINYLTVDACTSAGYIDVSAKQQGGIIGYYNVNNVENFSTNYYYDASCACSYGSKVKSPLTAVKLTKSEIKSGFLCTKYGHQQASHWSSVVFPTCSRSGSMQLLCNVCGQVLESQTLPQRSHYYEYGECIYCGAEEDEEDSLIGSIFQQNGDALTIIVLGCALLSCGAGCVVVLKKRKKKKAN